MTNAATRSLPSWTVSPSGVIAWSRLMPGLQRRLARPRLSDLSRVRRLGILRPDGLGDLILTTGMLRELRRQLPDAHITLICQMKWADWMRTCPWVDAVVDVKVTSGLRFSTPRRAWELLRFIRRVWPLDLEVVIQPGTAYWYVHSRALAWFSGAPVRLCWEDATAGVDTGAIFHTQRFSFPNGWHETEKCFRMLDAMGFEPAGRRLETWWTHDEAQRGEALARDARRGRRLLVALGLAGSAPEVRWPADRYLELVHDLQRRRDVAFLVLGGSDVAATCRWLAEQEPDAVRYAGPELPLGIAWATISHCDLYLGHDTGLMHMAAAARVPVVAVIGVPSGAAPGTRGDPSHTGPYDTPSRVVRPSAAAAGGPTPAIARVSPEDVVQATLELV